MVICELGPRTRAAEPICPAGQVVWGSGGIEADLEFAFPQAEQVSSREDEITPGFEQIEGMHATLGVGVGQVISPSVVLSGLSLLAQAQLFMVLG